MASISVELLINQLTTLIKQLQEQQDDKHTKKLNHLREKLEYPDLSIALCGHFSAGKSTLINTLCEAKLLPSSPIPTSANVVTLAYGEVPQAEVEIMSEGSVRTAIVPIEQLSDYCVDGETYTSVQIKYPSAFLKQGIKLLDTPGIDSTDDAHRMSTESALHLADVVFYVMDYNHVQSEINFSFAKQLKEWGKPLYFIVNQIDKHREEELSFADYRQSVWQAFEAWHLEPAGILYLSLKAPEHKEHQWQSLLELSKDLVAMVEPLKLQSVKASLHQVINDHIVVREWREDEILEQVLQPLGGKLEIEQKLEQLETFHTSKLQIINEKEQLVPQFRVELEQILKNANITPAPLRDKMALFLESQNPGFKQGFLFTKSKTEAEQTLRLQSAYDHFVELVKSNIEWHIGQALRQFLKSYALETKELDERIALLQLALPNAEWLIGQRSTGAVFGNEYTITYCHTIAEAVKRSYKDKAISILENIIAQGMQEHFEQKCQHIDEQMATIRVQLEDAIPYFDLKQKQSEYRELMAQVMAPLTEVVNLTLPTVKLEQNGDLQHHTFVEQKQLINISQSNEQIEVVGLGQIDVLKQRYLEVSEKLYLASNVIQEVEQLQSLTTRLKTKADRLKQMNFTISLFGAFSAGKSSLANALIGDAVLPVSPNPTTAAINSILPPDDQHPHNTATIYMKSEQTMLDDLIYSLKLLGLYPYSEKVDHKKLFELIDKIKPEDVANSGRAHYSFVKAARKGWITEHKHLGQAIEVEREQYVAYVADESLSCYVSEIKFYYHCPLTASGIVLVDTPGADSVNARHTGVAFNYIKNTDAIIFVTYYNHAFSHADRQFLDQLGRVKDQFALDKMFFVVNAADLAASEDELKDVLKHVETNLEQHQIKQARLFPISSIMALEAKQQSEAERLVYSGMQSFEQQFYAFIQSELGELVVQSALNEYKAIKDEVSGLIATAKRQSADKDNHITRLRDTQVQLKSVVEQRLAQPVPDALKQEIKELTFYIVQRLQLRFTDFYNYAINPAVIKDDGRMMQQVLYTAWLELERTLALELKQELLATTMRVNKFSQKLIEEQAQFVRKWLEQHEVHYTWTIQVAELGEPAEQVDWHIPTITSKWLWHYFKSAKQFFEQQGKQQLKADLEPLLFDSIKLWMNEISEQWVVFYNEHYANAFAQTLEEVVHHTSRTIEQAINLLHDEVFLQQLEKVQNRLDKL